MLNKLIRFYIALFVCASFFTACSSRKKDNQQNQDAQKLDAKNLDTESAFDNTSDFSDQQLNYQIKKLNSEINYIKEQVMALDVKALYADPFDVYNKNYVK